jgi:F-type H+-transporting ATPase subunit gamma
MLIRRGRQVVAEFSALPAAPSFQDVSAIGRLVVDEYLEQKADEVCLVYTRFISLARQELQIVKLLPLEVETHERVQAFEHQHLTSTYIYEPSEREILDEIIPRFTALQVYQAILESLASEHAARMIAMRNATDNANEMADALTLEYNKVRQEAITTEMLDLVGATEALATKVDGQH